MFEVIVAFIVLSVLLLSAIYLHRRYHSEDGMMGRYRRDSGFGGTKGWDESYSPGMRGDGRPFPVGSKSTRKKDYKER